MPYRHGRLARDLRLPDSRAKRAGCSKKARAPLVLYTRVGIVARKCMVPELCTSASNKTGPRAHLREMRFRERPGGWNRPFCNPSVLFEKGFPECTKLKHIAFSGDFSNAGVQNGGSLSLEALAPHVRKAGIYREPCTKRKPGVGKGESSFAKTRQTRVASGGCIKNRGRNRRFVPEPTTPPHVANGALSQKVRMPSRLV